LEEEEEERQRRYTRPVTTRHSFHFRSNYVCSYKCNWKHLMFFPKIFCALLAVPHDQAYTSLFYVYIFHIKHIILYLVKTVTVWPWKSG